MVNFSVDWDRKDVLELALTQASPKLRKQVESVIKNNTEKLRAKNVERVPKPGGSPYGSNPYATGFTKDMIESSYPGPLTGKVSSQSSYGAYLNFGTRFMAAQPFFTDSYEYIKPLFETDIKDAVKGVFL